MNPARILAPIAAAALLFTACSGDSTKQEVIDKVKSEFEKEDSDTVKLDESCLSDVVNGLSDDDAKAMLEVFDALDNDTEPPEVSPAVEEAGDKIFNECLSAAE